MKRLNWFVIFLAMVMVLAVGVSARAQIVMFCGDGYCDYPYEDEWDCPEDCSGGGGDCNYYAACDCPGEPACPTVCLSTICGDGICVSGEPYMCPMDCPADLCCGDGLCDYWTSEDPLNCPIDCACSGDLDCDGLPDSWEDSYACVDSLAPDAGDDPDSDGIVNHDEFSSGTDPCSWDTDGDFVPDEFELMYLDPFNSSDGDLDPDGDGMPTKHEFWNGTDPWVEDPAPEPFANPGCYYWGDGDGDGIVGVGDVVKLELAIAGMDLSFQDVIPQGFESLDLDKDGIPGPGDKILLDVMITQGDRPGGYPSSPTALTVVSAPPATVAVGATTHVTVALANDSGFVTNSGGFGVVFTVESGSATLLGGEGTDLSGPAGNRYDVTGFSLANAEATIVIRVDGPGPISIGAKVPACGVEPVGRWSAEVPLSPSVTFAGQ